MNKPVIVLGAGGHASVLVDMLRSQGVVPLALVAPAAGAPRAALADIPLWHDEEILTLHPDEVALVNGIGSLPGNPLRATLFARYRALGYRFASVVSAQAMVSDYAVLEEGVQVMAGAIIQAGTHIGPNSIVNTGAIVDHDCWVGGNNHIAPGAVLSGGVSTEDAVHIGTGAMLIQNIKIGSHTVVGAGATVIKDLANNKTLYVAKPFLR
ncbi:acetyltransferase [Aeromonas sp. HMWF016]|uniref:acetyltransferase n=1 Tax=Aeromonas sp. HMWF016 TaxID=2056852 RepID=UPI000D368DC3|nr:acetyltransferase [Aeromonas sp. HMWF016]PTT48721.1 shikimate dehydrogenase [Aeromonas sp. HMWF016]